MLLGNLLLALAWLALTGEWTPLNFLVAFTLSALLLAWSARNGASSYPARVRRVVAFAAFFVWELLRANGRVTAAILRRRLAVRPALVALPLAPGHSDASLTLLANIITLTPGTLSLDISRDRQTLYIHVIDVDEVGAFRHTLKESFERRVLEVLQ